MRVVIVAEPIISHPNRNEKNSYVIKLKSFFWDTLTHTCDINQISNNAMAMNKNMSEKFKSSRLKNYQVWILLKWWTSGHIYSKSPLHLIFIIPFTHHENYESWLAFSISLLSSSWSNFFHISASSQTSPHTSSFQMRQ
mgnify:CR=1 FL=1